MKKILVLFGLLLPLCAHAADEELTAAMNNARAACGGISEQFENIKKMAGINTAITGVGTGVGAGAVATGIMKNNTDQEIADIDAALEKFKSGASIISDAEYSEIGFSAADLVAAINGGDAAQADETKVSELEMARAAAVEKSKNLGNARTGLMAAGTATSIAGAVIAGKNQASSELKDKIQNCIAAVNTLATVKMQSRMNNSATEYELVRADNIISACGKYANVNADKINDLARVATVSSAIGAGTGISGTITSAVANSDNTRSGDANRANNLNTASNVLAGATTVTSAVSTVFNAVQIKTAREIIEISDACQETLK